MDEGKANQGHGMKGRRVLGQQEVSKQVGRWLGREGISPFQGLLDEVMLH